jgi:hypothetical protein
MESLNRPTQGPTKNLLIETLQAAARRELDAPTKAQVIRAIKEAADACRSELDYSKANPRPYAGQPRKEVAALLKPLDGLSSDAEGLIAGGLMNIHEHFQTGPHVLPAVREAARLAAISLNRGDARFLSLV